MIHYRFLTVSGVKLFYREAGVATAPVILLLHGYPTSSHMFRNLIPMLSTHYRVIAPDLPGFGYSDLPAVSPGGTAHTFDAMTAVMQGFIGALGLKRFALYVFDYGAPVGYRLAVANPEKISGIISQNGNAYAEGLSTGWEPLQKYWKDPSAANREALKIMVAADFTRFQYVEGVDDPTLIAPEAYTLDQYFLDRPGSLDVQLDLMLDYRSNVSLYPVWQAYFRAYQPRLLAVWGDRDPFFLPPGAEAYKRDIPSAVVKFYPTGHFALETHVAEIAEDILSFLGTIDAGGPAGEKKYPLPPFTRETALQKVQLAEDAWNSKDPEKVSLAYSVDTQWRNRTEFINGREEVKAFLRRKWQKELGYKLKKELWGFRENRMAVRFEYEWHDEAGQWYRSYGNELWEFDEHGLMRKRFASINDAPIAETERRVK
jgi:nuclear transport factor 2 (NTF2) superfamily protein/pimeloyl-ACP methyl ester carboxylesterase